MRSRIRKRKNKCKLVTALQKPFNHTVRAANSGGTPVRDGKGHQAHEGKFKGELKAIDIFAAFPCCLSVTIREISG
jgi:hypothetical protein